MDKNLENKQHTYLPITHLTETSTIKDIYDIARDIVFTNGQNVFASFSVIPKIDADNYTKARKYIDLLLTKASQEKDIYVQAIVYANILLLRQEQGLDSKAKEETYEHDMDKFIIQVMEKESFDAIKDGFLLLAISKILLYRLSIHDINTGLIKYKAFLDTIPSTPLSALYAEIAIPYYHHAMQYALESNNTYEATNIKEQMQGFQQKLKQENIIISAPIAVQLVHIITSYQLHYQKNIINDGTIKNQLQYRTMLNSTLITHQRNKNKIGKKDYLEHIQSRWKGLRNERYTFLIHLMEYCHQKQGPITHDMYDIITTLHQAEGKTIFIADMSDMTYHDVWQFALTTLIHHAQRTPKPLLQYSILRKITKHIDHVPSNISTTLLEALCDKDIYDEYQERLPHQSHDISKHKRDYLQRQMARNLHVFYGEHATEDNIQDFFPFICLAKDRQTYINNIYPTGLEIAKPGKQTSIQEHIAQLMSHRHQQRLTTVQDLQKILATYQTPIAPSVFGELMRCKVPDTPLQLINELNNTIIPSLYQEIQDAYHDMIENDDPTTRSLDIYRSIVKKMYTNLEQLTGVPRRIGAITSTPEGEHHIPGKFAHHFTHIIQEVERYETHNNTKKLHTIYRLNYMQNPDRAIRYIIEQEKKSKQQRYPYSPDLYRIHMSEDDKIYTMYLDAGTHHILDIPREQLENLARSTLITIAKSEEFIQEVKLKIDHKNMIQSLNIAQKYNIGLTPQEEKQLAQLYHHKDQGVHVTSEKYTYLIHKQENALLFEEFAFLNTGISAGINLLRQQYSMVGFSNFLERIGEEHLIMYGISSQTILWLKQASHIHQVLLEHIHQDISLEATQEIINSMIHTVDHHFRHRYKKLLGYTYQYKDNAYTGSTHNNLNPYPLEYELYHTYGRLSQQSNLLPLLPIWAKKGVFSEHIAHIFTTHLPGHQEDTREQKHIYVHTDQISTSPKKQERINHYTTQAREIIQLVNAIILGKKEEAITHIVHKSYLERKPQEALRHKIEKLLSLIEASKEKHLFHHPATVSDEQGTTGPDDELPTAENTKKFIERFTTYGQYIPYSKIFTSTKERCHLPDEITTLPHRKAQVVLSRNLNNPPTKKKINRVARTSTLMGRIMLDISPDVVDQIHERHVSPEDSIEAIISHTTVLKGYIPVLTHEHITSLDIDYGASKVIRFDGRILDKKGVLTLAPEHYHIRNNLFAYMQYPQLPTISLAAAERHCCNFLDAQPTQETLVASINDILTWSKQQNKQRHVYLQHVFKKWYPTEMMSLGHQYISL